MAQIQNFRDAFKINQNADLQIIEVAVDSIYGADKIASEHLGEIEPINNQEGFRIYSFINLLGRIFEHSQAMLVAAATGSPAGAEALARVVVEGSVNLIYLATLGDVTALIKFYRSWTGEHDRKLTEWKQKVQAEKDPGKILAMIEERRKVVSALEGYIKQVEGWSPLETEKAEWPKALFKRFEAIGRETDYFESYHRLSGASHLTGEDTLTWLISLNMPIEVRHKLGKEAWAYSIMMTRMASIFFVDAVAACVIAYGRRDNDDLKKYKCALGDAIHEIARQAGVPFI